jgi:tubulin-specific chaperone D
LTTCDTAIIRKFFIKITQRIGLTFFKEKIAKWRYQRGSRVLAQSIVNKNPIQAFVAEENNDNADEDDEEEEVPAEIEDIIEQLMLGLKDRDTIVRWSAAKGVGRITNRLSRDMAEDILNSILELFQFMEDDSAWHGGFLLNLLLIL